VYNQSKIAAIIAKIDEMAAENHISIYPPCSQGAAELKKVRKGGKLQRRDSEQRLKTPALLLRPIGILVKRLNFWLALIRPGYRSFRHGKLVG
jgi:hypothetical protein